MLVELAICDAYGAIGPLTAEIDQDIPAVLHDTFGERAVREGLSRGFGRKVDGSCQRAKLRQHSHPPAVFSPRLLQPRGRKEMTVSHLARFGIEMKVVREATARTTQINQIARVIQFQFRRTSGAGRWCRPAVKNARHNIVNSFSEFNLICLAFGRPEEQRIKLPPGRE